MKYSDFKPCGMAEGFLSTIFLIPIVNRYSGLLDRLIILKFIVH